MLRRTLLCCVLCLITASCAQGAGRSAKNPRVLLQTTLGNITVELYPEQAPITVKNFLAHVSAGFYDGTIFHRVIPGFMVQGGGFTAELRQKPVGQPIKNEATNGLKNVRGSIAMARTALPDSATSQFFINLVDNTNLNRPLPDGHGYAVFGTVVKGMDVVDRIAAIRTGFRSGFRDVPETAVVITGVSLLN